MTPLEAKRIEASKIEAPQGSMTGRRLSSHTDLPALKAEKEEEVHPRESPYALCHTRETSVHSRIKMTKNVSLCN